MRTQLSTVGIPQSVLGIDLEPIMVKAMMEEDMTLEQVTLGVLELQRFYALAIKYPNEPLTPSKLMDKMWHLHILDTLYYGGDCEKMFGKYLHHFPYMGLQGEDDVALLNATFSKTKELYLKEFAEEMHQAAEATVCNTDEPRPKNKCCNNIDVQAAACVSPCTKCSVPCGPAVTLPARPTLEHYLSSMH